MSQTSSHPNSSQPLTIFVVDDEPMLLDLAVAILEPLGYTVRTFRDPQMALAEFAKARPALVVTDYQMSGLSGMELIHECRRIHPQQRMLLLSGTVDERIYAADPIRPDIFLEKPYQVAEFIKSVRQLSGG